MRILVRTAKLKVENLDVEEYLYLFSQCSEIYNYYTAWAYNVKSYNKNKCHHQTYEDLKKLYPSVKIALLQSVRDVALESVKRGKFKCKQPKAKKLQSLRLQNNYSYSIRGKMLSLIGLQKRNKTLLHVPEVYEKYFSDKTWKNKSANLCYDSQSKQLWIHIVFQKEIEQAPKKSKNKILGLDRGIYNTITDSTGRSISSKKVRKNKRKYLYNRRKLQQKGTRSAKKKLKKLSGKEKRFMRDYNHVVSKQVSKMDYDVFVLEDLKGILKRSRGKKINKWLGDWSFYQFQTFLEYKCEARGKSVVYIDPRYTSQKCNRCGTISKNNRRKSRYRCSCGYSCHADHNAAKNIKDLYTLSLSKQRDQADVKRPIESAPIVSQIQAHTLVV